MFLQCCQKHMAVCLFQSKKAVSWPSAIARILRLLQRLDATDIKTTWTSFSLPAALSFSINPTSVHRPFTSTVHCIPLPLPRGRRISALTSSRLCRSRTSSSVRCCIISAWKKSDFQRPNMVPTWSQRTASVRLIHCQLQAFQRHPQTPKPVNTDVIRRTLVVNFVLLQQPNWPVAASKQRLCDAPWTAGATCHAARINQWKTPFWNFLIEVSQSPLS